MKLPNYQSRLIFYVNGEKIDDSNVDPRTTLASYIRQKLKLTGTKIGCNEGGCGACTVMISELNLDGGIKHYSVNACLTLVCSVHGKAVTTVEGIGSVRSKLHPVQEVFSKGHGSQCGFCTPGFIMAMYSLLRNNSQPAKHEIDEALQGNLCRCTGYRPILESFYTFAKAEAYCQETNGISNGVHKVNDLKDKELNGNGGCCGGSNGNGCCLDIKQNGVKLTNNNQKVNLLEPSTCRSYDPTQDPLFPADLQINDYDNDYLRIEHDACKWFRPVTLEQLLELKKIFPEAKLVVGDTEIGVEMKFKNCNYPVLISPIAVPELKKIQLNENGLFIGASVSLSDMEKSLKKFINELPEDKTKVFAVITKMLHWFAGKHIRNAASVAGNLMTASPISDLNPLFMASGSIAILESELKGRREVVIDQYFFPSYRKTDTDPDEILIGIKIPFSTKDEHLAGYKQAQRREDDIAIVNAGMRVVFKPGTSRIDDIRMSFGGMAPTTVMVTKVMKQLVGREWNNQLLEDVTGHLLLDNLPLPPGVPGGMERYRQTLCLSFFYKFYLTVWRQLHQKGIVLNDIATVAASSIEEYEYEPMTATQVFHEVPKTQSKNDSVGKPEMHMSGEKHTTGEAIYCDDVQVADVAHTSFVISQRSHARIIKVDPSAALNISGVIAYIDHRDIPKTGLNVRGLIRDEKIFIEDEVTAFGQVIGMIVAESADISRRACQLVKVEYENLPSIITIEQAMEAESYLLKKPIVIKSGNPNQVIQEADNVIEGEIRFGGQEHFYLETHACIAIPREGDELEVISSTQDITELQIEISRALGIPSHKIVVKVKRIGGGFGGKQTAALIVALPCAVAAMKLRRPVRCSLERFDDMAMKGTRHPYLGKYKMAYTKEGKLTGYHVDLYSNGGYSEDLSLEVMYRAVWHTDNAYKIPDFYVSGNICKTNCPSSTAFRGFGCPQAMFVIEQCISDIAYTLGVSPETLREKNLYVEGDQTFYNQTLDKCNNQRCWNECIEMSSFYERRQKVEEFNRNNRWKKRGISLIPTKYGVSFGVRCLMQAGALVHIYKDGSVLISHGGMEMGQGLHTKMAQVATRVLGVPLDCIFINDTSTDKVPNSSATAASISSDLNGEAVRDACDILMTRLRPFMEQKSNKSWPEICAEAYKNQTNLSANGFCKYDVPNYFYEPEPAKPYTYFAYGAGCSEVEIDCLTGDHRVLRTDLVVDVGDSLNPAIDIGQIEGAFIQGYGLMTMEEMKYSPNGVVYTRGPGTYKIPSADDVPRHFNVKLLKNSSNPNAVFSSKAVGEPPLFLGSSVFFAIKDAVKSARDDANLTGPFRLDSPATPERIRLACEDKLSSKVSFPKSGTYQPWTVQL